MVITVSFHYNSTGHVFLVQVAGQIIAGVVKTGTFQ